MTNEVCAEMIWILLNEISNDPNYAPRLTAKEWQQIGSFLQNMRLLYAQVESPLAQTFVPRLASLRSELAINQR
jgi:hypothetical protein